MFGYIVTYLGGIITGVTLLYANRRSIDAALVKQEKMYGAEIDRLNWENAKLRTDLDAFVRNRDCSDAYHRGKRDGRNDPVTDAERFAQNFEGHRGTVEFRNTARPQQTRSAT